MAMTTCRIPYLLRLLDVDGWFPRMSPEAVNLLGRCGSKLEQMCLLGLIHAMDERRARIGQGPQIAEASWGRWDFVEPWLAFRDNIGPSSLEVEPQAARGTATVDFLILINGEPAIVVEVDGYAHHRDRRDQDRRRDLAEPLPTIRIREETDSPLTWPARILDADPVYPCTHCGVPIEGEHSCPPF